MSTLILSVSASISSSVCWPTTLRSVVWAIWLIASSTFSMATTDFGGVDDPVVRDGRDVDAHVVPGDDALGLDRHRHDAERHLPQHVDERHDDDETGLLLADHPAESEDDALFVLLNDVEREGKEDEGEYHHDDNPDDQASHLCSPFLPRLDGAGSYAQSELTASLYRGA